MCIPPGFPRHFKALHSLIAWNHILYYSSFNMTDVRLTVSCRRTIKEHVSRSIFPTFYRFFKNLIFIPKFKRSLLSVYKFHISFDFSVQCNFPSFPYKVYARTHLARAVPQGKFPFRELCIPRRDFLLNRNFGEISIQ